MALPIKITPVLRGEAARKFLKDVERSSSRKEPLARRKALRAIAKKVLAKAKI